MTDNSYQPLLPGVDPPDNIARREPHRKDGETWQAYCTRYETWFQQRWSPEARAANRRAGQLRQQMREEYLASGRQHCSQLTEDIKHGREGLPPRADAVFFWYGGTDCTGPCTQSNYISAVMVNFLIQRGVLQSVPYLRPEEYADA